MRISPFPGLAQKTTARGASLGCLMLLSLFVVSDVVARSMVTRSPVSGQRPKSASEAGSSSLVHDAAELLQAGRLEEAEAIARRAVAGQPRNTAARSVLGAI